MGIASLGLTGLIALVTSLGLVARLVIVQLGGISGLGQLVVDPLSNGKGVGAGLCKQCAFKRFIKYRLETQCHRHFANSMAAQVHGKGKWVLSGVSPIDVGGKGLIDHLINQSSQRGGDVAQQIVFDASVFDVCVFHCIVQ